MVLCCALLMSSCAQMPNLDQNRYQQSSSGGVSKRGIDPDAEFLACVEREKPTRTTARCASTLFEHYVSEPSHPLKPAKLRFAASFQKTLLAYDKGADAEQTKADINMITAQFLQDVQAAGNAAIQSQRAVDANNAAGLRAIAEAVKAAGQPQHMMSSEEYRERMTTRPSFVGGKPALHCEPERTALVPGTLLCR
jgi:hypothetical protein